MIGDMFPSRAKGRRPRGSVMVETACVLLVFLGFIFLIVDETMVILAKATLQHAVRSGVRYAITSQTSGSLGQLASIKQVVQQQAMGFLSSTDLGYITIDLWTVTTNPPTKVTGPGSNAAGNLVVVSVSAWPFTPLAPILHSGASIPITVSSGDLIESSGSGTAPPPL